MINIFPETSLAWTSNHLEVFCHTISYYVLTKAPIYLRTGFINQNYPVFKTSLIIALDASPSVSISI